MPSPFEVTASRLGERVESLRPRAQVVLYGCAAEVLFAAVSGLAEEALREVRAFSLTGVSDKEKSRQLLGRIEQSGWGGEQASTAEAAAWTCCDIALSLAHESFAADDGTWYLLEPQFHATCERLFGVSDVGSEREQVDEARALEDPNLRRAVDGVNAAIGHLVQASAPTEHDAQTVRRELRWLHPGVVL